MNEPIIKVVDVAWIPLGVPDLDRAEAFLGDFGLLRQVRSEDALYMRGTGTAHHLHITHRGPDRVLGIGFRAETEADLHRLAAHAAGASGVMPLNEPGGGKVVRLKEHNGFTIEVMHGQATVAPLPERHSVMNTGAARERLGVFQRIEPRPCQVKRMGHAVLSTPDLANASYEAMSHPRSGFPRRAELDMEGIATAISLRSAFGPGGRTLSCPEPYVDRSYLRDAQSG